MSEVQPDTSTLKREWGELLLKWLPLILVLSVPVLGVFAGAFDGYIDARAKIMAVETQNGATLNVADLKTSTENLETNLQALTVNFATITANTQANAAALRSVDETQKEILRIMLARGPR